MDKKTLYNMMSEHPVFLDGATGTNLQKAGMPTGVCPELWIYEHQEVMRELQKSYIKAGTQILYAPTFTANRIKLDEYGLVDRLLELNRAMVGVSRDAIAEAEADHEVFVAGDLTMTGEQLAPLGELEFEELVDIYKEQVRAIMSAGVDLFVVETMMSLQECRAALLAIREIDPDIPVMISLTYNDDGRTLYGTPPEVAMVTLQSMGADIVGLNCSTGPDAMLPLVESMAEVATIPILSKPNAGLPELIDGETQYRMTPEEFSAACGKLLAAGVSVIGGCCGTTPDHIKRLVSDHKDDNLIKLSNPKRRIITSERKSTEFVVGGPFIIVGERINPTGKKALQSELRDGKLDMVCDFARAQEADGAAVLDVNFGMNGIDEDDTMKRAVQELVYTTDLPLCIDSSFPEVVEAALRIYPGRALINSISGETEKYETLLPIAKKYGAMFILLPLNSTGLPKDNEEKHSNIDLVLNEAKKHGLSIDDCIVDVLVSTVGADEDAALKCFDTASYCRDTLNVPTICGLSNISFGLPQRTFINTAFLSIGLAHGLTSAISNPGQELLKLTAFASDLLLKKGGSVDRYINSVPDSSVVYGRTDKNSAGSTVTTGSNVNQQKSPVGSPASGNISDNAENFSEIALCVINGDSARICEKVQKALDEGAIPGDIIDGDLIPAINEVGARYESKKFFLPQLISGANAMKAAMELIEPLLIKDDSKQLETIVVATVEGDIHDIGKNLVVLMLKNYGYNVIDLGKDVPASVIVDAALENHAAVIGLSALMTTTMLKMKEVVLEAKSRSCDSKIVIGGACITQSFADEIGADGYSEDAAGCVKLVQGLLAK